MKQKSIIVGVVVVLVVILVGVLFLREGSNVSARDWREIEFKDVTTGETFKISDFAGKPILLESFAVWCPTCKQQQDELKKLHEEVGDSVISISLDTDPNEDERKVVGHIERNGYSWLFAISSPEATQALIDEFGLRFVSAPSAPVIYINELQEAEFLRSRVKSSQELKLVVGL